METLESYEKIHEAAHGHHHSDHDEHHSSSSPAINGKIVAILISLLAALLAIVEMGGKSAQTESVIANIAASDIWNFYQAKKTRTISYEIAADSLEAIIPKSPENAQVVKLIDKWRSTAARYISDPQSGEGSKELLEKAKHLETEREHALAAYHMFEFGGAALQLSIVLASAAVVTGMMILAWAAGGLGLIGAAFGALGWFAPMLLHHL